MSVVKLPKTGAYAPNLSVSRSIGTVSLRWQSGIVTAFELLALLSVILLSDLAAGPAVALLITVAAPLAYQGLRPRLALSSLDELPKLVNTTMTAAAIVSIPVAILGSVNEAVALLITAAVAIVPMFVIRTAGFAALRKLRRSTSRARDAAVIVGSGAIADYVAARMQARPEFGLRPVGYADNDPMPEHSLPASVTKLARICTLDDFPDTLSETRVTTVVFAYSRERESDLVPLVRATAAAGYHTYVVPRFFEATDRAAAADSVWGLPLNLVSSPSRGLQRIAKRSLDIAVAGFAFLLVSPLLAFIALTLPRETRAGILFRQQRIGKDGRTFELLKFQTMAPETKAEGDTTWNIAADDRLGPYGRFLRRTSLDELPQLWNVLRGDMSLVGPRPERPHFVAQFSAELPHYADRHRVPVGLTGWAQIHRLRGDTSIDDRARFDNVYCDSWSVWEDVKIICRTLPEVLRSAGR